LATGEAVTPQLNHNLDGFEQEFSCVGILTLINVTTGQANAESQADTVTLIGDIRHWFSVGFSGVIANVVRIFLPRGLKLSKVQPRAEL
jgi:hypothetical protein